MCCLYFKIVCGWFDVHVSLYFITVFGWLHKMWYTCFHCLYFITGFQHLCALVLLLQQFVDGLVLRCSLCVITVSEWFGADSSVVIICVWLVRTRVIFICYSKQFLCVFADLCDIYVVITVCVWLAQSSGIYMLWLGVSCLWTKNLTNLQVFMT